MKKITIFFCVLHAKIVRVAYLTKKLCTSVHIIYSMHLIKQNNCKTKMFIALHQESIKFIKEIVQRNIHKHLPSHYNINESYYKLLACGVLLGMRRTHRIILCHLICHPVSSLSHCTSLCKVFG